MDILDELQGDAEIFRGRPIGFTIQRAANEIERLRSLTAWQPIETAPKDGTSILGSIWAYDTPGGYRILVIVKWVDEDHHGNGLWVEVQADDQYEEIYPPTHWLPLPTPPES